MKIYQVALLLPIALLTVGLTTGCGGSTENTVIESPVVSEADEAAYEEESYGGNAADDASQN